MNRFQTLTMQRNDQPLTNEQIARIAPAVFAEQKHDSRSERYQFISSADMLDIMRSEGFMPVRVMQNRTRVEDRKGFAKHAIVLRHEATTLAVRERNELIPELLLVNSHDGGSAFQLHAACFRLICTNGLIVADSTFHRQSVPHRRGVELALVESAQHVARELPQLVEQMLEWRALGLSEREQLAFSRAALTLRWDENEHVPVTPAQLNTPKRFADRQPDLYHTMNRVQENVVQGGIRGRTADNKPRRTSAVNSVDANMRFNKALNQLTAEFAEMRSYTPDELSAAIAHLRAQQPQPQIIDMPAVAVAAD